MRCPKLEAALQLRLYSCWTEATDLLTDLLLKNHMETSVNPCFGLVLFCFCIKSWLLPLFCRFVRMQNGISCEWCLCVQLLHMLQHSAATVHRNLPSLLTAIPLYQSTPSHLCLCWKPDSAWAQLPWGGICLSAPLWSFMEVFELTAVISLLTEYFLGFELLSRFSVLYNLCWWLLGNNFLTSQGLQSKALVWRGLDQILEDIHRIID